MKLNLNRKGGSTSSAAPPASSPVSTAPATRPHPRQTSAVETYGRAHAPPPPGSSYWEFHFWATEGGMPLPEDTDLAIKLWMGVPPDEDEEPAPSPR